MPLQVVPTPVGRLEAARSAARLRAARARFAKPHKLDDLVKEWYATPADARRIFAGDIREFLNAFPNARP